REIAAKTNTPLGTVKTRLELGLKKIYEGLKELRDELSRIPQSRAAFYDRLCRGGGIRGIRKGPTEVREKRRRLHHEMLRVARSVCAELATGKGIFRHQGPSDGDGQSQATRLIETALSDQAPSSR